jgi:osmotically-inducible protein OsmY
MKIQQSLLKSVLPILLACLTVAVFAQERKLTDENITSRVNSEMFWQTDVPANEIDISTNEGIVTLTGAVGNILAKERAEKVAMATRGVQGVINKIVVEPVLRPDSDLREDLQEALMADPATEQYDVTLAVDDGVVTLSGEVESWREKQLAGHVVKGVKGVKQVENNIDLTYPADRPDNEIEEEVEAAIQNDIRLYTKLIQVNVDDGVVGLSGSVGSLNEKLLAKSYAWTTGVRDVSAKGLNVHDWADNEDLREKPHPDRTDAEIRRAVNNAFFYDARVNSFNPKVRVDNGIVTLSGTVSNLKAKRAAANDAKNVVGVSYVKNNLKVRPENIPSEEVLRDRVESALQRNADVERYQIDVDVWNSTVYLNGTVDSYFEKYKAQDVATTVRGVVDVVNNLKTYSVEGTNYTYPYTNEYYPSPYIDPQRYYDRDLTDEQIEENISDELWWSPFVNEYEVNVEVDRGIATLSGTVDSWDERDAAIENAREGGAKQVIDYLTIDNDL